jgi:hypothetical protein
MNTKDLKQLVENEFNKQTIQFLTTQKSHQNNNVDFRRSFYYYWHRYNRQIVF